MFVDSVCTFIQAQCEAQGRSEVLEAQYNGTCNTACTDTAVCTADYTPVCGSNSKTYCEYSSSTLYTERHIFCLKMQS